MARRNNSTQSVATTPATESNEESNVTATEFETEAAVAAEQDIDSTETEPTEGDDEGTTEPTESAPAAVAAKSGEVDLTAFNAAVATALQAEGRDETTGELPLVALPPVQAAYRDLDGLKAKNAARKVVDDAMKSAMTSMKIAEARSYLQISQNLSVAGAKSSTPKPPADPTEAFVQKAATFRLALTLASANVPDEVAADWADQAKAAVEAQGEAASAYLAWVNNEAEDKGDAPEAPAWVQQAAKLAAGKSAKVGAAKSGGQSTPFTGERRDIAKHIVEAFADAEPGTFKSINEIRTFKSAEYGDNPPSAGAISARLFPGEGKKVTVDGVTPDTQNGKKGAVKA